MKTYMSRFLILALVVVLAACGNDKGEPVDSDDMESEEETIEVELEEEATDEHADDKGEADDIQLEEKQADEENTELIEVMKEEEGIEDAMAYVTDDGYVLATFFADETMTEAEAEALAEAYGEKLQADHPDHIIDIEVMQGDDFLTYITLEP